MTWEFMFEVITDVEDVIMDVIKSNEISTLNQIIDPC